eukprot:scaffold101345_cov32-Tisochrysis_lutea.AAC.3
MTPTLPRPRRPADIAPLPNFLPLGGTCRRPDGRFMPSPCFCLAGSMVYDNRGRRARFGSAGLPLATRDSHTDDGPQLRWVAGDRGGGKTHKALIPPLIAAPAIAFQREC